MSAHSPQVKETGTFNFLTSIWIVPLVAVIVAGWLAYKYYADLGPEIKIIFPKNEGLKAGQSVIKYKDVVIGTVTRIELENEGANVAVYARMDKTTKPYLNEYTKFWIVKPEVGIRGISGLDTLISGTYIDTYAQKGGELMQVFTGVTNYHRVDEEGTYFHLNASGMYNVESGTPVYYKNFKVGSVEYVTISVDGQSIDYYLYILKPYDAYIHTDSKFWVQSAVDVDFSNGRLDVNVAPITRLIQGGIAFSSSGEDAAKTVPDHHVFHLYKNEGVVEGKRIGRGGDAYKDFEVHVFDSLANLNADASVKYDGYDVGRVKDIDVIYDPKTHKMSGKVYLRIDTSFFDSGKENNTTGEQNFYKAVEEGLRVQITPTDPISGMLYVNLVFKEDEPHMKMAKGDKYPILPSISCQSGNLTMQVNLLVHKLNTLLDTANEIADSNAEPIGEILASLNETTKNINTMMAQKELQSIPKDLDESLKHLTQTLKTADKTLKGYGSDSLRGDQLAQTLKAVQETSNEMKAFLKVLNRKPEAMVFGEE